LCAYFTAKWTRLSFLFYELVVLTGVLPFLGLWMQYGVYVIWLELESTGIKVNATSPGFTKTNLNNYAGTQTVEEGAREPVRLALLGPDGPTGTFSSASGPIPW
jgi:hypothetical protein